jgi:Lrp/AsnC family transcriptional regulator for asnA, asnC and gidA
MAMLGIQVSGNIEEVADILAEYEQITFLTICAGSYDIMIEVVYQNTNSLLQLIQKIRSLPGVKNTDSFVYLKTPKSLYSANPGIMNYSIF